MASLFGGLFKHAVGTGGSDLFSEASKYKAHHDAEHAVTAPGAGAAKKRKAKEQPSGSEQQGSRKGKKAKGGPKSVIPVPGDAGVHPVAPPEAQSKGKAAARAAAGAAAAAAAKPSKQKQKKQQQQQGEEEEKEPLQPAEGLKPGKKKVKQGSKPKQHQAAAPPHKAAVPSKSSSGSSSDGDSGGESDEEAAPAPAPAKQRQQQQGAAPGADKLAAAKQAAAEKEEREAAELKKLVRTVFVGNLQAAVSRKALQKLFSKYGKVESVRVRSLPVKADGKLPKKAAAITGALLEGRASAHAYIVFEERAAAEAALAHNMQEFDGLHLRVDRAAQNSKGGREEAGVQYDPARSLFVGNLPRDVEDEDVIRCFMDPSRTDDPAGGVEGVRVVRDPRSHQGRGIAFVLFKSREAAKAGLLLDGKQLKGRPLRVTRLKRSGQQAAGGGSSFGGGGKGAQQRGGGGGKGGEQGGKAGSKATAASWQGTMTKGRGKLGGSRGGSSPSKSLSKAKGGGQGGAGKLKGKQRAAGGPLGVRPVAGKRKASGKRPAVAAKKQRQLAAKGSKKAK